MRALPASSDGQITIRHEPVPDFVDAAGRKSGMPAMTMGFDLAPGVELESIDEGSRVRFRLEVDWEGSPPARIVQIERLPADAG